MSEVTTVQADAFTAMIERAASNPAIDVQKLQQLLDLQERILDRAAKEAFARAMGDVQAEIGRISANKPNEQTKSRYADLAKLDQVIRPIYTQHGFALSFGTEPSTEATVQVVCDVMHRAGHTQTYKILMPADGKGAKGGDVMTKTHATGSAMTYGRRYLLAAIFNIAVGDDDGNAAQGLQFISEEQQFELDAMINDNELDRAGFMVWLKERGPETLDRILAKDFAKVRATLQKAIAKKVAA